MSEFTLRLAVGPPRTIGARVLLVWPVDRAALGVPVVMRS